MCDAPFKVNYERLFDTFDFAGGLSTCLWLRSRKFLGEWEAILLTMARLIYDELSSAFKPLELKRRQSDRRKRGKEYKKKGGELGVMMQSRMFILTYVSLQVKSRAMTSCNDGTIAFLMLCSQEQNEEDNLDALRMRLKNALRDEADVTKGGGEIEYKARLCEPG